MTPHTYSVGQPYLPGRTSWAEGSQCNYRSGEHELLLFYPRLRGDEITDVRRGQAEFGLVADGDLLLLLYRFGRSVGWSDAPYSWHLVPEDQRTLPEPEASPETRALLHVILVDAATGIIRGLRAVTLSPAFTRALHAAIRAQAARPWPGAAAYDTALYRLYQQYPSTDQLLTRATARTIGGAEPCPSRDGTN